MMEKKGQYMSRKNFLKSSAILFVGDLLTKVLGFVYLAPLARIDEGIGTIQGLLMTPYSFFITFSVMGITNVMMFKLGPVLNDKDLYKRYFLDGVFYVLITSVVITGILVAYARPMMVNATPAGIEYLDDLVLSLQIIAISILFFAINTLIRAVMLSKNYVTIISITYISEQAVKLVVLLIGCYYYISVKGMGVEVSAYVTAASVTISVASTTLILIGYSIKMNLFDFMDGAKYKWTPASFKSIFTLGIVYFVNSVFINGFSQIDLAMFADSLMSHGYSVSQAESMTGIYFTWSWKLIMLVITLGSVFVTIMIQQMTRVPTYEEKLNELKSVFDLVMLYSLLATVFFLTAGEDFYAMFYGTRDGVGVMMIQSLLVLPIMVRMQLSIFLITVGERRVVILSTALIFLAKIIFNPILFEYFEVYGFVYSSILACVVSIAFMLIFDHESFQFSKEEYLKLGMSTLKMICVYLVSLVFTRYIHGLELSDFVSFITISVEILVVFGLFNIKAIKQFKTMI